MALPATGSQRSATQSAAASIEHVGLASTTPRWLTLLEAHPLLVLTLLTGAMLLPWLHKPFHIDDPMFIWAGEHIRSGHLIDFYGFRAVWTAHEMPMHQLMQNPPLASYLIALVGVIAGVNEFALHTAFFVPALLLVIGTWRLGREHCRRPGLAAALVALMPVFVLCSSNIMSDVMLTCCWVWAVHFWDQGLKRQRWAWALGAGAIAGVAFLAKYPAMNILPLMVAYSLVRRVSLKYLFALAIPIVVMIAYEMLTKRLYGAGLLSEAFTYAQQVRLIRDADPVQRTFVALCFTGGCMAPALFLAPFLWGTRGLLIGACLFFAAMIGVPLLGASTMPHVVEQEGWNWPLIGQIALWATGGAGIVALCIIDLVRRRDASAALFAFWILGTIVFAGIVNWSVNGRTLLPMAPAVAIMIVRGLEAHGSLRRTEMTWQLPAALSLAALLALTLSWADDALARAGRRGVERIVAKYGNDPSRLWFQGHWGFHYYMEKHGARPLLLGKSPIQRGDHIAIPVFGTNVNIVEEPLMTIVDDLAEPVFPWASVMSPVMGAGFYSNAAGPLPFVFGTMPAERYLVQRVNVAQSPKE
jgi:4-amino-4-deoxy-L-arabinose transferase-like glycosyltransferase